MINTKMNMKAYDRYVINGSDNFTFFILLVVN
jgi:hypothetical protein